MTNTQLSPATVAPLNLPRLIARLKFHDYEVSATDSDVSVVFSGTPIIFSLSEKENLIVSATLATRLPEKKYQNLAAACTVINSDQFLPKIYPFPTDSGWSAQTQVVLNVSAGLSDSQLDDHLGLAISAVLAALGQAQSLLY